MKSAIAFLFLTVFGYILFNVAIIESESSTLNLGVMNAMAGLVSAVIFRKELRAFPKWWTAILGAVGICGIVFGLRWTHAALKDPASTMEVVYDVVVFSSVGLWVLLEKPLGLQKTKVHPLDIVLHVVMALLVIARLQVHWQDGWQPITFIPALFAVSGYWLFNVSIRLSQKDPDSTRSTNVTMNLLAGSFLVAIAIAQGRTALSLSGAAALGTLAIVIIVYFIGRSYRALGPLGMAPFVMVGVYDGLLICAPIAMILIYKTPYVWQDFCITIGFVSVMATRLWYYRTLSKS